MRTPRLAVVVAVTVGLVLMVVPAGAGGLPPRLQDEGTVMGEADREATRPSPAPWLLATAALTVATLALVRRRTRPGPAPIAAPAPPPDVVPMEEIEPPRDEDREPAGAGRF
jgi:hypothetical protein